MVGLSDARWSSAEAAGRLAAAAEQAGHTVREGEAVGEWRTLDLVAGPLPSATLLVSGTTPGWAFTVNGNVLGDEDEADGEAQASAVDLLGACAAAVPLYLGTAVWPFGPETPASYDTSGAFAASQAGPVMYVGPAYVEAVLGGTLEAPKGWHERPVGPGRLLVVKGNLLREPNDPVVRRLLKRLRPSR